MGSCKNTRISEKRFYAIPLQALTADGQSDGTLTVASTYCWKVGQILTCVSSTVAPRRLKIKAVLSETVIKVGAIDTPIYKFSDVSDLLLADNAMIELVDDAIQSGSHASNRRPVIDLYEIWRQVYEEEPTVAVRSHLVDWLGRSYCEDNPIPVQLSDGSINIGTLEVQLSHRDNVPDVGDVADSVQIGDGTTIAKIDPNNRSFSVNRYEKILPLLANAKWLELVDYEGVDTEFAGSNAILSYFKDGNVVAKATFTFIDDYDWSFTLESYMNDDNGDILLNDDNNPLFLD